MQTIRTMAEVYGQIKANYYQDKPDAELFEGAMKGMVSDLDPHSEYMDKKGYAEMKESTSGEFGGLGMEIGQEDGFVKVVAPIEDTPAERAGVKSGDFIVKIDNTSTRGLTVSEAVKKNARQTGYQNHPDPFTQKCRQTHRRQPDPRHHQSQKRAPSSA